MHKFLLAPGMSKTRDPIRLQTMLGVIKKIRIWSTNYYPQIKLRLWMIQLVSNSLVRISSVLHKKMPLKVSIAAYIPHNPTPTSEIAGVYQTLGCKRLSDLIQEEYQTTQETYQTKTAQEGRSLILERLPLFLYRHTDVTPRVSPAWLNREGNFIVRTFRKITVNRSINFAGTKSSKSFDISASARHEDEGPIELWLSDSREVDVHEVATSLCRLLLHTYKVNDTFLFGMLLSTDLHTLRSRGYPGNYEALFIF